MDDRIKGRTFGDEYIDKDCINSLFNLALPFGSLSAQ